MVFGNCSKSNPISSAAADVNHVSIIEMQCDGWAMGCHMDLVSQEKIAQLEADVQV